MTETFTCQNCKKIFEQDPEWTDADAAREYRDTFGHLPPETKRLVVCEECFNMFARAFGRGRQRDLDGSRPETPDSLTRH